VTFTPVGVIAPSIIELVDSCALVCDDNGVADIGFGSTVAVAPIGGTMEKDIVATAMDNGSFMTLVAALQATTNLVPTLQGEGPFTVFAPNDEAFAALPPKLVPCLLLPDNQAALTSILTYHVASGEVLSSALSNGQQIPTVQGGNVGISITTSTPGINDAPTIVKVNDNAIVLVPDVMATNGVIHVIDSVLVPPTLDLTAFLSTCPEIVVPVVVPEGDGDIVDQLGDLFDGIQVDELGDTIGDAVGELFQNDSFGDEVGNAINTVVQSFMGLISGGSDGWRGFGW